MTSIFEDTFARADPSVPVTMTPRAAADGGPDDDGPGGGLDFSVFFGISASLGRLVDELERDRDRRATRTPPSNEPLLADGTMPSSGNLVLDLGSVPQGRVWQVRRLIIGGVAVTTAAAGAAYAFAQGAPPNDLNISNCVDIFTSLPRGSTYGTHQLFLLPGEHLFVVIVGGTATQQYAAAARVEDWEDAAFYSTFSE